MRFFIIILAFILTITYINAQSSDAAYKIKNAAILVYNEVELLDFAGPRRNVSAS